MPPVPGQEGDVRVHPIPAVQPHPRFAARVAAGIFAGEALILTAVALLAYRSDGLGNGRVAIPATCALVAVLLYTCASTVRPRMLKAAIVLGTVLVSVHALSAKHEPALSGEMLYVWLGLFAAYFFSTAPGRRAARLHGGGVPRCSGGHGSDACGAGRWLTLVGILFPAGRRPARGARRRDAAREPPLGGRAHRHADRPEEPSRARPRAARRGGARAALGRAAEPGDRRPRLLQVRERPPRPPRRRRGARARRTGAAPVPPRGRLDRPHRRRGVHDPAAGRERARGLSRRRAHARRCRARVPTTTPRGSRSRSASPPTPITAARRTP